MAIRRFNINPKTSVLNRTDCIARGLKFAYTAGDSMGGRSWPVANSDGSRDLLTKVIGVWNTTIDPANYEDTNYQGRLIGTPVTPPGALFLDFNAPAGATPWDTVGDRFTAYVAFDSDKFPTTTNESIFSKRVSDVAASAGWGFYITTTGALEFHFSDGVTQVSLAMGTVNLGEAYTAIVTREGNLTNAYLDGVLVASSASTVQIGTNTAPVRFFGNNDASLEISAGILWGRPLVLSEVHNVNNDPYVIFRWYKGRLILLDAGGGGSAGNFFLSY